MDIVTLDQNAADDAVALWQACGLTRPWNDPYSDFGRAVEGPSSAVLGMYDALGYEEQDTMVLGRRFDGSSGGAIGS